MLGQMRTEEELKNLQMLLKQLIFQWSFGKRQDAQVPRTLQQQLNVLQQWGLELLEKYAMRALMSLAVRALLRQWACEQAS